MLGRRAPLAAVLFLCACSRPDARQLADGGLFEIPDSGRSADARVFLDAHVAAVDSGPYVCEEGCPDGSVCGCIDTQPRATCGCNPRGGYTAACDPQAPESCKWPFECVRARSLSGVRFICSDGREGTPCSHTEDTCHTENGCVCLTTPLGLSCSCQGSVVGENPFFCDPLVPSSCPEGTCVRVEASGGAVFLCSGGEVNEPCVRGDQTCHTSLGCTCPLIGTREICRCSEPGTAPGDPCDISVEGSCAAPLTCRRLGGDQPGEGVTECVGRTQTADGGVDCTAAGELCGPGMVCVELPDGSLTCQ